MTLREEIRIEIIKWLGSQYHVTQHGAEREERDFDQNRVEELVSALYALFTPSESSEAEEYKITVNGLSFSIPSPYLLHYKDIVAFAGHNPDTTVLYTIAFHKAFDNYKHEGTLLRNETLYVSNGTHIACYHTGAA